MSKWGAWVTTIIYHLIYIRRPSNKVVWLVSFFFFWSFLALWVHHLLTLFRVCSGSSICMCQHGNAKIWFAFLGKRIIELSVVVNVNLSFSLWSYLGWSRKKVCIGLYTLVNVCIFVFAFSRRWERLVPVWRCRAGHELDTATCKNATCRDKIVVFRWVIKCCVNEWLSVDWRYIGSDLPSKKDS